MAERRRSPLCLCLYSSCLVFPPLVLLVAQVVLMDRDAQDHLGAVLVDYKLIQVLSQCLGRDMTLSNATCSAQRTPRGLVGLVKRREALAAKVGAVVRRLYRAPDVECAAADAVEGQVGRPGLRGNGTKEAASDYHGGLGGSLW
jgi:hypothetical protein